MITLKGHAALSRIAALGLALAGMINLLPVTGVLGAGWLKSLYGFDIAGADLEILLRHRALLFGMLGVLLIVSALLPRLRDVALVLGGFSMASFIAVALGVGNYGPAIGKIIIADVAGLFALVPAALLRFATPSSLKQD